MRAAARLAPLVALMALGGCIPRGAPTTLPDAPPPLPRIEPDYDALTNERPVWEAHPATSHLIDVPGGTYTVQPHESLRAIGIKTGVGWETLARVNTLTPPYNLTPGTMLTVPAGRYHVVQAGESGIAIARAYGVHWSEIVALNGLTEPYVIHTDQRLMLPAGAARADGALAPAARPQPAGGLSLEARAAAFTLDDVVEGGSQPAQDRDVRPTRADPTPQHPLAPTTAVAVPKHFSGGTLGWPLKGQVVSAFGPGNAGIDIAAPSGSLVNASANGAVAFVGQVPRYGGTIILTHGEGWLTIYSHLARITVVRGAQVRRGAAIGITGGTTLHFEVRQHKTPINPLRKLG